MELEPFDFVTYLNLKDEDKRAAAFYIKPVIYEMFLESNFNYSLEILYECACLLEDGFEDIIIPNIDQSNLLFEKVVCGSCDYKETLVGYPLIINHLDFLKEKGPSRQLFYIAKTFIDGIDDFLEPDEKRAFEFYSSNLDIDESKYEEIELMNVYSWQSKIYLALGDCYMNGIGTDICYSKAIKYYLLYRNNQIAFRCLSDDLDERLPEIFFKLYEESRDDNAPFDTLYYLGVMYQEGIGCYISLFESEELFNRALNLIDENHPLYREISSRISEISELKNHNIQKYDPLGDYKVGDIVSLGKYDNRSILWQIVDIVDGQILLVSRKIIETSYIVNAKCGYLNDVDEPYYYDACASREWLNSYFFSRSFDASEKGYIVVTDLDNSVIQNDDENNEAFCQNTSDFVFLLSKKEINKYFPTQNERIAIGTEHAKICMLDVNENGYSSYWLRTPSSDDEYSIGYIDSLGYYSTSPLYEIKGIRPALWVRYYKQKSF